MFVLGDFQEVGKNGFSLRKTCLVTNQIVALIAKLRYLVIETIVSFVAVKLDFT